MPNIMLIVCSSLFYRLPWVQRCCPRATPDFGSLSVISSFVLQDIPKHDTHLFEVREAFKRFLLPGFRAYISAYIAKKKRFRRPSRPPGTPAGACAPVAGACAPVAGACAPVAVPDAAGPLIPCPDKHRAQQKKNIFPFFAFHLFTYGCQHYYLLYTS